MGRLMIIRSSLFRKLSTEATTNFGKTVAGSDFSGLPYDSIPGPKPLPILGNTWRLLPVIGQYKVSDVAKISELFHLHYGKIVRLTGLIGRPDLLFVYDADEIEKIYRHEGPTPFRPSMPCLVHYKGSVRKEFFGELPGVVGV